MLLELKSSSIDKHIIFVVLSNNNPSIYLSLKLKFVYLLTNFFLI